MCPLNQRVAVALAICVPSITVANPLASAGQHHVVRFDLPHVVVASPTASDTNDASLVTIQLPLSSMIETPEVPRIDQWLVQCQPRDHRISIADYAPQTETASDLATPIQIKQTEEKSHGIGLSIDGSYGHLARGNAGSDHSTKNSNTLQFDRIAPVQAVTASGTINRGRGVYFKLRWTAQQVLEGEKTFQVTLKVPPTWRGGLIDVSVVAQSEQKSLAPWDQETKVLGAARFVVAAYRANDNEAALSAHALADAEHSLRSLAVRHNRAREVKSLPSMIRHVAMKLDLESSQPKLDWLEPLLLDQIDPHLNKEIRKLPMPTRIAILEYADRRDQFVTLPHSGEAIEFHDSIAQSAP